MSPTFILEFIALVNWQRQTCAAQSQMKCWIDKRAEMRSFKPGDQVLLLLPVPGSTLQARYSGPYTAKEKVNDRNYIISTPDWKRQNRPCHSNMLKLYLTRGPASLPSVAITKNVLALSGSESVYDSRSVEVQSDTKFPATAVDSELIDVAATDVTCTSGAVVQG